MQLYSGRRSGLILRAVELRPIPTTGVAVGQEDGLVPARAQRWLFTKWRVGLLGKWSLARSCRPAELPLVSTPERPRGESAVG